MTCKHAQTTTLLWLYGEYDGDHLHHVVDCPECTQVMAEHTEVLGAIADTAPALRQQSKAPTTRPPHVAPKPSRWRRPLLVGVPLAAAALLFAATRSSTALAPETTPTPAPILAQHAPERPDLIDTRLEQLEDELLSLSLDLEVL